MRIAFFVTAFPVPSETFVVDQIVGAQERGHVVDIYALERPNAKGVSAIPHRLEQRVRYLTAPRGAGIRLVTASILLTRYGWRAFRLVARALNVFRYPREAATLSLLFKAAPFVIEGPQSYDAIHCQFGPLGCIAMRLRQIGALQGPLITTFRGYDGTKYLRTRPHAYDELFREGELFLPVSEELKRLLVAHGADPAKIEVHHSGVDLRKFSFCPRTRANGEPTRILSIGRLVEKKGIEFGIRAVAHAIENGHKLVYDIVGDGELRERLEQLIAQLEMKEHVRLLGWRSHDEIAVMLNEAHILVAPSVTAADGDQEGIATVLQEAMAMGMPVVATWHAGTAELVKDGVSGFLVAERDVEALADRIGYLVDHPERWLAMGHAGRVMIQSKFDLDRLNDQLELFFQRLSSPISYGPALVGATLRGR